ncbi:MAG: flagellar biosynthetic protein FliO [Sphingorhabdus sp.]
MWDYVLRLTLLLPLVGGLAWASLWLSKRFQSAIPGMQKQARHMQIIETLPLGGGSRLAIIEFGGKHHLVALARGVVTPIASDDRGDFDAA